MHARLRRRGQHLQLVDKGVEIVGDLRGLEARLCDQRSRAWASNAARLEFSDSRPR